MPKALGPTPAPTSARSLLMRSEEGLRPGKRTPPRPAERNDPTFRERLSAESRRADARRPEPDNPPEANPAASPTKGEADGTPLSERAAAPVESASSPADAAPSAQNRPGSPTGATPQVEPGRDAAEGVKDAASDATVALTDQPAGQPPGQPEANLDAGRASQPAGFGPGDAARGETANRARATAPSALRGEASASGQSTGPAPASSRIAALLSAPLTATNLAELLATIDPRLVEAGLASTARLSAGQSTVSAVPDSAGSAVSGVISGPGIEPPASALDPQGPLQPWNAGTWLGDQEPVPDAHKPALEPVGRDAPRAAQSSRTGAEPPTPVPPTSPLPPALAPAGLEGVSRAAPSEPVRAVGEPALAPAAHPGQARGGGDQTGTGQHHAGTPARAAITMLEADPHLPPAAQLARGLTAALKQGGPGGGTVTLKLHPAALGQVQIAVELKGEKAAVRFTTSSSQARGLLSSSLDALRATLEGQGLSLDRVSVEEPREADPGRKEPALGAPRTDSAAASPREAPATPGHGGPGDLGRDTGQTPDRRPGHAFAERDGGLDGRRAVGGPTPDGAGGAVHLIMDGVHDDMGRLLLRLDAMA